MNLKTFGENLESLSKSEKDMFKEFIAESVVKDETIVKEEAKMDFVDGFLCEDIVKSEKDLINELIEEGVNDGAADMSPTTPGVEARAKDLKLDQIIQITQELSDGTVKKFKFKVIELWPTPTNFFTVVSIAKPKDQLNFWTLFYDNTWYIKKSNKSLINVHVKLV